MLYDLLAVHFLFVNAYCVYLLSLLPKACNICVDMCLQEPQYLTLLSALDDLNIYVVSNAKKLLNAPTNYAFCLRVCLLVVTYCNSSSRVSMCRTESF